MAFYDDLESGKIAEAQVIEYFTRKGWKITDLRASWYWRKRDCDIQIEKDGRKYLFEIKRQKRIDTHKEIIIEMYDYNFNRDGWYYTSLADFYIFVPFEGKDAFIISSFNLKNYIENNDIEEDYNSFTNCCLIYLRIEDIKEIIQKIEL